MSRLSKDPRILKHSNNSSVEASIDSRPEVREMVGVSRAPPDIASPGWETKQNPGCGSPFEQFLIREGRRCRDKGGAVKKKYRRDFPGGPVVKNSSCNAGDVDLISGGGFPGGSEGNESACNAGTRVPSLGREDPLEKGMTTHSSILAWRIPWTEEPGGLQSMGSQRDKHD